MNGRSTRGTTGLGKVEVSGRSRVASPPARISACIASRPASAPADALVIEPGLAHDPRVEEVAPVDHELAAHTPGCIGPVEVGELGPLCDQDDRVCALDGGERVVGEL